MSLSFEVLLVPLHVHLLLVVEHRLLVRRAHEDLTLVLKVRVSLRWGVEGLVRLLLELLLHVLHLGELALLNLLREWLHTLRLELLAVRVK